MNQPLVSVIVPNYNHARYLEQRLDSVFGQTYQNFEVIILDDCSTDNSLEVINHYKDNPHLSQIIVNDTNSCSVFKQWDKGMNLAEGEIIWIAESDDYCELNMLEELVSAYLHSPNSVIAYSTSQIVDADGVAHKPSKYMHENKYFRGEEYVCKCLTLANVIMNASSTIFRKQAALKVRPNYKQFVGAGDYLFWTEIAMQGDVAIVDKQLNYFRRAGSSVTDRVFANGTAPLEDMIVFRYIDSAYHLSLLRKRLAYAFHAKLFGDVHYIDEETRRRSYTLWEIDSHRTRFDKFLLWGQALLKRRLNIYL